MRLYRWEVVDTRGGQFVTRISIHITRRGAERRRQRMNASPALANRHQLGYELKVRRLRMM